MMIGRVRTLLGVWLTIFGLLAATLHPALGAAAEVDISEHARDAGGGVVGTPNGDPDRALLEHLRHAERSASGRTVIGPDERMQVSPALSAVALLEGINQDETSISECTGTFIAPDVLITAAHCLHADNLGGWASNLWVTPGMDGYDNIYPFGFDLALNYWVPSGWIDSRDPLWDFGLILMPDGDLGNATGWFEVAMLTTASLENPQFHPTITGYPGDKPHGTQWIGSKSGFVDVGTYDLSYDIDTYSGQSGSSIIRPSDGRIVGVHAYGGDALNYGTRIEQSMLDALLGGCNDMACGFDYYVEQEPPPPTDAFDGVWRTTDQLVAAGQAGYSWFWGPGSNSEGWEDYLESPGGERYVRYYDKSRMEISDPNGDASSIWYVTNGLLTVELVTGRMQTGNANWVQYAAADVPVAGDPLNNPGTPSYAEFASLVTTDANTNRAGDRTGQLVTAFLSGSGQISTTQSGGVTLAHYRDETGHNIASVFWDWANSPNSGLRPAQGVNWLYVLGFPISEPYWIDATVGGSKVRVLVQLFERRALTYTPTNPAQFQVEFGNIGQHYYRWRYED